MGKKKVRLTAAEKELLRNFGERVRGIRIKAGLSVYDVTGKDMPIRSRQHWQRIENGQKNINLSTVLRIAASLKVSIEELAKNL